MITEKIQLRNPRFPTAEEDLMFQMRLIAFDKKDSKIIRRLSWNRTSVTPICHSYRHTWLVFTHFALLLTDEDFGYGSPILFFFTAQFADESYQCELDRSRKRVKYIHISPNILSFFSTMVW